MPDARPTLYLIDGTAQLFRAYFAIRGLTNDEGLPTNAVFGFTSMLRKLIRDEAPDRLAVVFDMPGDVFRHETYAAYKANRPPAPEDLNVQVPYAKQVCEALGVAILERSGWEADDLIATYSRLGREHGLEVVVVASDKDLLQLVGDGVIVLNPSREERYDAAGVETTFGVRPEHVRDVLGLMGDSVDNIPGVPGVGQKTAVAFVSTYGDIEAVIARAERFVAAFDARDALLAAVDRAIKGDGDPTTSDRTAASLRRALDALLEIETDEEFAGRLRALAEAVDASGAAGLDDEPDKDRLRALRTLKREAKSIDKGSSRRAWYAIVEHAAQARMSRELATLRDDAPIEVEIEALRLDPPRRKVAAGLFRSLGFRSLTKEFEAQADGPEQAGDRGATAAGDDDRAADAPADPAGPPDVARDPSVRGEFEVVTDEARLAEVVEACRRAGRFALDTETDGIDPMRARLVGISLAHEEGRGVYVPIGHDYLGAPEQIGRDGLERILGPLLADESVGKIGQNWKYDAHVLRRHRLAVRGWTLDTMVLAFLLNSDRSGYGLDGLAEEYLGYTTIRFADLAGSGAKQKTLNEIDVDRVGEYAAEDADVTLRLARRLEPRLDEVGVAEVWRTIDGPLLPLLVRIEAVGIRVDVEELERMSATMDAALERLRSRIHGLAGGEFNVDSPKQLREVLFDKLGLKPRRKTAKSGVASTDAQTLDELVGEHPIAEALLEYRETAKLKGTYVDALPRMVHPQTGRVHTSYHATGAATGRLSSSDPNLQNIPVRSEAGRAIRSAFVPEPGHLFVAADYSQVELRVLAHLCGDEELIAAFNAGEDIHRYTASRVFGVAADLVSDQMRRRAKAVNFGILYGMSETRLAREQGMSRADAKEFISAYFDRFARVREYIEGVREQALRDGAVRTMFGRVRWFPQLKQRVHRGIQEQALRAAVNTTIQGTAADLMKLAMLRVDAALRAEGLRAEILLQVHDELLLEAPEDEAPRVAELVRSAMEGVRKLAVPLSVDQETGRSWLEVT